MSTIKIKAPAMPEPGLYVDPAGDCFPSFTGDAYTAAQLAAATKYLKGPKT